MKEGCEEMRVVNFDRKFDEDVLVAKATLLEAVKKVSHLDVSGRDSDRTYLQ